MKLLFLLIAISSLSSILLATPDNGGFIENKGQIVDQNDRPNPGVLYLMNGPGINVQLRKNSFSYDTWTVEMKKREPNEVELLKYRNSPDELDQLLSYPVYHFHRVDVTLEGASESPQVISGKPTGGIMNYYLEHGEFTGIQQYSTVTYQNVYPNIDLEFFIRSDAKPGEPPFEYQFVVRPGGNPADIVLSYSGSNGTRLKDGKILVNVVHGEFYEKIPASFTEDDREPVDVKYTKKGENRYAFQVAGYNPAKTLVIDPWPQLLWGTYYGGISNDQLRDVESDALDNAYVCGQTASTTNIATAGAHQATKSTGYDGYLAKIDLTGQRIWGTYYGGTNHDYFWDLTLDATGTIYAVGSTLSAGAIATAGSHQTVNGGGEDGFLVKFDNNGVRQWGTYYGGTGVRDVCSGVRVTATGAIYVVGETNGDNGIATAGTHQPLPASGYNELFIARFDNAGVRQWGTYYGGTETEFFRDGIRVDASENIYLTGYTVSDNGIATAGTHQDVFGGGWDACLAQFNSAGIMQWGTYFGGAGDEQGFDIVLDAASNIYFCGWTSSASGIATTGAYQDTWGGLDDGYLAKFTSAGTLLAATYFGGPLEDMFNGIDMNAAGDIVISGSTKGSTGLATEYVHQDMYMGTEDIILVRFNTMLQRVWMTYYGGTLGENSWDIKLTPSDYIYVTGDVKSTSGISTPGVFQPNYGGSTTWDGYLARFVDCSMTTVDSHVMPLCFGDANGTATVTPQYGTPMYFYVWDNTETTQTISGLQAGDYMVTIADSRGCRWQDTVSVLQPNPLVTQAVGTDALCFGGSEGTIAAIPVGGTPVYSYVWDNGCTDSLCTTVAAGTYEVTVYDAHNCTTTETVTIGQPTQIAVAITPTDALCHGSSDGIAVALATGGTPNPDYSYLWSNAVANDTATGFPAGEHYVTVTDGNGCTMTDTVLIGQPDTLLMSFTETAVSCFGYDDGAMEVTVTGGIVPYQYVWDNSDTTEIADTLTAGTYLVTVTDDHNCSVIGQATVTEPPLLTAVFDSIYHVSCHGFSDGFVSSLPSGGTPGYFWNWSSGSDSSSAAALIAGTYFLTVTDLHNCLYYDTVTVTEPDTIAVSFTNTTNLCYGDQTGTSQVNASGGTAPYQIAWSDGNSGSLNDSLFAGWYFITLTDDHACVFVDSTEVIQPDSIQIIFSVDSVACNGGSDGRASVIILGGTNPFSYLWDTGSTNDTITGLSIGTYSITITDANNCVQMDSVTIAQPSPIRLYVNYYNLTCWHSNDGAADASAIGGAPPFQFLWSTGHVGPDVDSLVAGSYGVTVYDSHGCTESLNFFITEPDLLVSQGHSEDVICYGENSGIASLTTAGGTEPYAYNWSNGYNQSADSAIVAGTYIVTTTDSHGCTDIDTITVVQPDLLVIGMDYNDVLCYNHGNGWTQSTVTGGILPYQYLWNTGDTIPALDSLVPGVYTLVVLDSNHCAAYDTVTIIQPDSLYYDYSVQHISCYEFDDGLVIGSVVGGTMPYVVSFENEAGQEMPFTSLEAATYFLAVTDSNHCVFNDTIIITQPDTLLPVAVFGIDPADNYGYVDLTVTGGTEPYTYNWSNNTNVQDIDHLIGGMYTVTITDDHGCVSVVSAIIDLELTIPDVITPNSDGYNDDFEILNLEAFRDIKLYIYNRWGTLLFTFEGTTQEYNNGKRFNGEVNGKILPMGSYAYIVILNDEKHYTGALLIKY